ncbi:hypothetical protein Tco_0392112, partial [Tanacetum coccineum]
MESAAVICSGVGEDAGKGECIGEGEWEGKDVILEGEGEGEWEGEDVILEGEGEGLGTCSIVGNRATSSPENPL